MPLYSPATGARTRRNYYAVMTKIRRIVPAVALIATTAVLAACGSGEGPSSSNSGGNGEAAKAPAQIVKDAQAATGSATSVHITGKVNSGGQNVQLDVVADHGRGGGTITLNGSSFQTVLDGKTVYLKADKAAWTKEANASVASLLADKWLKTTTDNQDFAEFATLLDISQLVSNFTPTGTLTKGKVTSIDGVPSVPVAEGGSDGGTMYVGNSGTPYIVAIAGPTSGSGQINFTQYNTAKIPAAPQGAIDLSQLEGGS